MSVMPPKFLFLNINEMCNLHCQHCEYWRAKRPSLDGISLARQSEIIREFAELSPGGSLVICGGEPMLDVNTYFQVCSTARSLGLRTLSVTNGTLIATPANASKVVKYGADEISISLDGPTEALHDRMRGTKGSFGEATRAIRLLVDARVLAKRDKAATHLPKIYAMGLLTASSYLLLDEFYDLVLNQLGADKLKINSLQPSFLHTRIQQQIPSDSFFEKESQVDPDILEAMLGKCERKYGLTYNPNWIRQVVSYFRKLHGAQNLSRGWWAGLTTDEHICNSPERNIMVDIMGKASLCFSNAFPKTQLFVPGDLKRYWEENTSLKAKMSKCNLLCGISHSVRREHATCKPSALKTD